MLVANMHRLDIPLYEDWHSDDAECITDIYKDNVDCVLVVSSKIKCKALLARLRLNMVDSSIVRPKLTILFNFGANQKVSGTYLSVAVNVWPVRFVSANPEHEVSGSQLNLSEVNAV